MRGLVLFSYVYIEWRCEDGLVQWLTVLAGVFGAAQILTLILIAIVTIDDGEAAHYSVAACVVVFSFILEAVLIVRRGFTWPLGCNWWMFALVVDIILILALVGLAIGFIVEVNISANDFNSLNIALLEYFLFWTIVVMPCLHLLDFSKLREKCD